MPRDCRKLEAVVNGLRRVLEDEVWGVRGEVSLADALCIHTATRWERHSQLAAKWLMREAANMTAADRLNYSREVARASAERDKAIQALGLPKRPDGNPWDVLTVVSPDGTEPPPDTSEKSQDGTVH